MIEIPINQPELLSIDLMRIALSEPSDGERQEAIKSIKLDIEASHLKALSTKFGALWTQDPKNAALVQWVAATTHERHEAAVQLSQIGERYDAKNERKLNIAEHIGMLIWLSIQDGRFEGLHTRGGILEQVSDDAREFKVTGAKDKDTLRKIWNSYRGVVHLGMAINHCEDNPSQNILHLAERFRRSLCENFPKGTSKPYVNQSIQFSFPYKSKLWGPRYANRGLPFGIE